MRRPAVAGNCSGHGGLLGLAGLGKWGSQGSPGIDLIRCQCCKAGRVATGSRGVLTARWGGGSPRDVQVVQEAANVRRRE